MTAIGAGERARVETVRPTLASRDIMDLPAEATRSNDATELGESLRLAIGESRAKARVRRRRRLRSWDRRGGGPCCESSGWAALWA